MGAIDDKEGIAVVVKVEDEYENVVDVEGTVVEVKDE